MSDWKFNEEIRSPDPIVSSPIESKVSSNTPPTLETTTVRNLVAMDMANQSVDNIDTYKINIGGGLRDSLSMKSSEGEIQEEEHAASEAFHGLDKMLAWGDGDNEWLYSLQTECARPGAVCECGDSCCCPGCFTHTNNPGDRGVYNTMINKLGAILEPEEEEQDSSRSKPCVPSSTKSTSNSTEAKL